MPKHYHPRNCPRCGELGDGGRHTKRDWRFHPDAGHGFIKEQGWSKPESEFEPPEVPLSQRGKDTPVEVPTCATGSCSM